MDTTFAPPHDAAPDTDADTRVVLVIDDEDHVREVVQICLETINRWHVLTARSGPEGARVAAATHPDVILLDVMMPEVDGPATFEMLQGDVRTNDIPVILLTARCGATYRRRYEEAGLTRMISKPFDPMRLGDEVVQALDLVDARQRHTPRDTPAAVRRAHIADLLGSLETIADAVDSIMMGSSDEFVHHRARSEAFNIANAGVPLGLSTVTTRAREIERMLNLRTFLDTAQKQRLGQIVNDLRRSLEQVLDSDDAFLHEERPAAPTVWQFNAEAAPGDGARARLLDDPGEPDTA